MTTPRTLYSLTKVANRNLYSLLEGGEQNTRLYISSHVLHFRLDWGMGDGPGAWLPVTDRRGHTVKGKHNATLKRQLNYWDRQMYAATQGHIAKPDYELAWGWATDEGSK